MVDNAVALVMHPGLADEVLAPHDRGRLADAVAEVADPAFDDALSIPDDVAAETTVLITGWGCPPLGAEAVAHLPRLGLVAHAAGSVKELVTPELFAAGVVVTTAADANARPVAEFTLASIVMIGKDVFASRDAYRANRSTGVARGPLASSRTSTIGNHNKTIGIVGASRIGRLVCEGLASTDGRILLYDPYISPQSAADLGAEKVDLATLCARSDVVSLHAPDLASTQRMIGAGELAAMGDGAWLINTARGALVDHQALTAELESGRLNALLDTTDPEPLPAESSLYDLPNVVLTPHIAGSLGNELPRLGAAAVDEVERFVSGRAQASPVRQSDLERMA